MVGLVKLTGLGRIDFTERQKKATTQDVGLRLLFVFKRGTLNEVAIVSSVGILGWTDFPSGVVLTSPLY